MPRSFAIAALLACFSLPALAKPISMEDVRAERGEPTQVQGPVGDPPITRWIYPDESIYFEYGLLLTRVPNAGMPQLVRTDGLREITP